MKRTFEIFTDHYKLCEFINGLTKANRKHSVTPWNSKDGTEMGFVVWYYI